MVCLISPRAPCENSLCVWTHLTFCLYRIVSWRSKTWSSPLTNVPWGTAPGRWACGKATCWLWRDTVLTTRLSQVTFRLQPCAVERMSCFHRGPKNLLELITQFLCLPPRCFWKGAECRFYSSYRLCGDLAGVPWLPEETCGFQQRWEQLCLEQFFYGFVFGSCWIQTKLSSFDASFFAESSKELEELRGAFSRSLDYMKQDVEESRWTRLAEIYGFDALGWVFVLFAVLCPVRVWWKWRSFLYHNADLGKNRGEQWCKWVHFHCEVKMILLIKTHCVFWWKTKENCYTWAQEDHSAHCFHFPLCFLLPTLLGPPL